MVKPLIGIIGAGSCGQNIATIAYDTGALLAQRHYTIICGGLGGVMAAACEGAKQHQGQTIGILPGALATESNPWVDIAIPTGMGDARNLIIVRSAIALIAISGEYGTLSEIAFALKLQKPIVGVQTWQPIRPMAHSSDFPLVETALEAVNWIQTALRM